ncbi:HK97-gp10 family putative phage morphogenesis protein [Neorhizobium sp. NCHU2750]|uniref:HK97-gp10 family putative phage morphogenesis protein n=1 Tax=Neorhizobium sp. NCHU2750 TaxID=1825976 RepID=UPI000E767514|nr:HK97 family phage protein [Neorhizobium sp. NCHU2750]
MPSSIRNLERLQKKLDRLPSVAMARIREAMEQAAGEIVALAKSLVPTDTGSLRDSIGWTWGRAPRGAMSLASVQMIGGDLTITIYAGNDEAYYARWIEFGTKEHIAGGKFKGATIPAQPARPFFYVSFRARRKSTKSRISRAITKAAKEVASGG